MSLSSPPAQLLELEDLLLQEKQSANRIYGRHPHLMESYQPILINDMFEFGGCLQPSQPFGDIPCQNYLQLEGEPSTVLQVHPDCHRQNLHSIDIHSDQLSDPVGMDECEVVYRLSDPEQPSSEQHEFVSGHEEEPKSQEHAPVEAHEYHAAKDRTPTKSSSTEVEVEHALAPHYSKETRQDKLKRYLEKRQNRNWNRKVSYDCRKKVADSRLRIKGRFVTREQAELILGQPITSLTAQEVKLLLESHFAEQKKIRKAESIDFIDMPKPLREQFCRKTSLASQPCITSTALELQSERLEL